MSNARKYITARNLAQRINQNKINSNNSHFKFHQKEEDNLSSNYQLYTKNKIRPDIKSNSNSFYLPHYNTSNHPTSLYNKNFNSTIDSFNKFKKPNNANNLNISDYKSIKSNNTTKTLQRRGNTNSRIINRRNLPLVLNNIKNNNNTEEDINSNLNINSEISKKNMNNEQIKNYIIYLKSNLNSSYYANNDLNNEYNKMISRSRQINDTINNNNDIYINMNKSYEEELEKNNNFKKEYNNLVDEYKSNHLNEQNKLKELNEMISAQDKDIQKLENENNALNEDISDKKIIVENLKKQIEQLKSKKGINEANSKYLYLFNKKNKLLSLNEKIKILNKMKSQNEELSQNMQVLKNQLQLKENLIIESQNIKNKLSNKLMQITQEHPEDLESESINTNNDINSNNNINNKYNLIRSFENEYENREDDNGNENLDENGGDRKVRAYSDLNNFSNNGDMDENEFQHYKKLFDEENTKGQEIQEKIKFFKDEINRLKQDIYSIKTKNEEEISTFKLHINNLSPNNQEIKNELASNKIDIINQKENLIKYNKKFRESLSEKNDLQNKINKLKIENKNIELKLNEKQKTIGFKIKAIKIRRGVTNNKKLNKERNMSDPDLLKNNKNDNLFITQNEENFIPKKEIYRYKRYEYQFRRDRKNNNDNNKYNRFKSRKSGSFDNIFKFNANNVIEQETKIDILSTPRSGTYLYTIDEDGKLLGYGITLKKYVYIDTSSIKGWRLFYKEYKKNSNGSLLLNTLAGLFVLTGDNYNHLYYYSQSKNIIYLIITLKYNHKYGGLILTKDNNKIIILGGNHTKEVELFNIQKNTLKNLPILLSKRINSSYSIIDGKYLVTFFGENNNTIEYLDLNSPKKWIDFEYKSNSPIKEMSGHIGFHINENIVVIVGGKNNDKIMVFYFKEKYVDVTDFILSFDVDCGIDELYFDREKCFNIVENKEKKIGDGKYIKEMMGMDNFGNVHCFDNDYSYTIFVF